MSLRLVRDYRDTDNRDADALLAIREEELAALRRGYSRLEAIIRVQQSEIDFLKAELMARHES